MKKHPFFKGYNWEEMFNKKYKVPFLPKVSGKAWMQNFDDVDGSSNIQQSIAETTFENFNKNFQGYEFFKHFDNEDEEVEK